MVCCTRTKHGNKAEDRAGDCLPYRGKTWRALQRFNLANRVHWEVLKAIKSEERDVGESYRNYVNSYIVKPVDFAQFLEVVAKANYYWLAINKTPNG